MANISIHYTIEIFLNKLDNRAIMDVCSMNSKKGCKPTSKTGLNPRFPCIRIPFSKAFRRRRLREIGQCFCESIASTASLHDRNRWRILRHKILEFLPVASIKLCIKFVYALNCKIETEMTLLSIV